MLQSRDICTKSNMCMKQEKGSMHMPAKEWIDKYAQVKEQLRCSVDLESYFLEKRIGDVDVDILEIGTVHFPTGQIVACDPLVDLEDSIPYLQEVPVGTYPVQICVVPSEVYGDRYACVKVAVSNAKPVRYEMGMTGRENLDEEIEEGEFFGFGVDAGMACVADVRAQEAYQKYWQALSEKDSDINPYDDLFCAILEENYKAHPKYQRDAGDWANWTVPGTDCNIPIFASGWGDGCYPCYFGYDDKDALCGIYLLFINIEEEFADD